MNQTYTSEEVRDLLLYVKQTQEENEELRSKLIAMNTMVKQREASLKKARIYISQLETAFAQYTRINEN